MASGFLQNLHEGKLRKKITLVSPDSEVNNWWGIDHIFRLSGQVKSQLIPKSQLTHPSRLLLVNYGFISIVTLWLPSDRTHVSYSLSYYNQNNFAYHNKWNYFIKSDLELQWPLWAVLTCWVIHLRRTLEMKWKKMSMVSFLSRIYWDLKTKHWFQDRHSQQLFSQKQRKKKSLSKFLKSPLFFSVARLTFSHKLYHF